MNEDQHDSPPENANDRALLEYLDDILGSPGPGRGRASFPRQEQPRNDSIAKSDKVTPLESIRSRIGGHNDNALQAKPDPRQNVTLPFRTAEKPQVLSSLNLLNLRTAPAPEPVKPKPELVAVTPVISEPELPPAEKSEPKEVPVAKKPAPVETPEVPQIIQPDQALSQAQIERLPQTETRYENGRPAWAQERFECLIFKVAGLKLAVPLITLGAIHRIDRKFNALPHQSDWFIGILQTPASGNIKVLDTALCVMPERYEAASRESLAYVLTIHGYNWGLACHELEKSITLEPDQVKWRTQRGKRPWLAGTVIEHMCALIDTDGFQEVILKAEGPV